MTMTSKEEPQLKSEGQQVKSEGHHFKSVSSFVSGGMAGVVAKTIIAPIERVKFLFIVKPLHIQPDLQQKVHLQSL